MRNSCENLLGFMFSCLFTQYKVVKGEIFTTVLQKHKLNPAHIHEITTFSNII